MSGQVSNLTNKLHSSEKLAVKTYGGSTVTAGEHFGLEGINLL
jgi:hypothetical protein